MHINMDERQLSIVVFSLFSSWMLAFLFEGRILYAIAGSFDLAPAVKVFAGMAGHFAGLLLCSYWIKTKKAARGLFLCSFPLFMAVSAAFFFPPSIVWVPVIVASSILSGGCVAAWGFYFKSGTPKNARMKTAADVLIYSNILMILLNMAAIHLSPRLGLALSMLMLLGAFVLARRLPVTGDAVPPALAKQKDDPINMVKLLAFLYLFIAVITINSGLMYQVVNPAFAHLDWLTSWYWAIPYIVALFVMRNLPRKTNRTYILYVAIAMIGLSFIAFVVLDRSVLSYFVVNTLMLGACGIYDLFWWSILGGMLDFNTNPAKVFGVGLSANVLGVLLGGVIGNAIFPGATQTLQSTLLALAVVCVTLALLPPLHKHLSSLLRDHAYLTMISAMPEQEQTIKVAQAVHYGNLSERENQVASLLLQRKTYKSIAEELYISENTVKYYVKNIYSKLNIQSRLELIELMLDSEKPVPTKK